MRTTEVETLILRRAEQELVEMVERTVTQLEGFQNELESFGEAWGNDDLGMLIGEVYKAALSLAMNCLFSNLDTVFGYADRLAVTADDYDATDQHSSQGLDLVRQMASEVDLPL